MVVSLHDWLVPVSIIICGFGFIAADLMGFRTALWGASLCSLGIGYAMMLFEARAVVPIKNVVEDSFILLGVILAGRALNARKAIDNSLILEVAVLLSSATMVLVSRLLFNSVKLETLFVQICCTIVLWRPVIRYIRVMDTKADKLLTGAFLFIAMTMSLQCLIYILAPDTGPVTGSWRVSVWGNLVQYTGLLGSIVVVISVLIATSSDFIEKYRRHADTDPLTGLLNRRGLDALLETSVGRRFELPDTVIILADIDHFKSVNDRFGHPFGDQVIARFAALLQAEAGADGRVARLGGEEFVILLTGIRLDEAIALAEKMRLSFLQQRWGGDAADSQFSASFGVTHILEGETMASSIKRADSLLYVAKGEGRNSVVASRQSGPQANWAYFKPKGASL